MLSFKQKGVVFMFGDTPEQKERRKRTLASSHVSGLPIPEEIGCALVFEEDNLTIKTVETNSSQFRVAYNKIVNLQTQTVYDVQNTMVSNPGGAIAGAMMFGAPGAMVGGRAKKKEVRTAKYYFIITYKKDNTLAHLHFRLWGAGEALRAKKLIEKYRPRTACPGPGEMPVVDL